jgi:predicted nucleic acid-binding protein
VIFIDSNVPMYLVGGPHPNKVLAQVLLDRAIAANRRLVADAEVLQEILHRYTAIGRREAIAPAVAAVLDVIDEIFPIEKRDVLRAVEIAGHVLSMSARDSVHLAVMERYGVRSIMSFDADFDRWPGVERIYSV